MKLSVSDIIQIIGVLVSLFTSAVAIIISIVTIRQNSKMIEESSRAVLGIYGETINPGVQMFFIVVKNFGNSLAVISKFESDFDFTDCYGVLAQRNWIDDLNNCSIAPGQARICKLDFNKITRPIVFDIEYTSSGKKYSEKMRIDLKTGSSMLVPKCSTKNSDLQSISYTLQEMLQKNL